MVTRSRPRKGKNADSNSFYREISELLLWIRGFISLIRLGRNISNGYCYNLGCTGTNKKGLTWAMGHHYTHSRIVKFKNNNNKKNGGVKTDGKHADQGELSSVAGGDAKRQITLVKS